MAECEMCGKKVGTRRHMVEGNVMNLGSCCSRFGTPMDQPASPGSQASMAQGLERRATRMTSKNIYTEPEMDFVEDFGRRILQARERKGLSREELGSRVHARVPEITKFESQTLRPTLQQAKAMEKELGVTLLEAVQDAPSSTKTGSSAGLTIGDLLKQAKKKG